MVIEKFLGKSGEGKFAEFLEAISDEKYEPKQREIALKLLALDTDLLFPEEEELVNQSKNIQDNLIPFLLWRKKEQDAVALKLRQLAKIQADIKLICDMGDEKFQGALWSLDESSRNTALQQLTQSMQQVISVAVGVFEGTFDKVKELQQKNDQLAEAVAAGLRELQLTEQSEVVASQEQAPAVGSSSSLVPVIASTTEGDNSTPRTPPRAASPSIRQVSSNKPPVSPSKQPTMLLMQNLVNDRAAEARKAQQLKVLQDSAMLKSWGL